MAKITQRKRRRVVTERSAKYVFTSESVGGSSSEDGEDRRWKTRRATGEDTKGKGKELVSEEDEFDDDDESSESDEENEGQVGVDQTRVMAAIEQPTATCGICLTEGESERGKLDCCEHYFCFACIMEWSKVESKCPMCKQRFTTVMRPAISGVPRSRVRCIRIPTRDQVYEPSEEEIRSFGDPYHNIVCTQCQEAGDEGLLLLCDQCDAAAHTYCVGLGRSVPRGDWFCDACILLSDNSAEDDVDYEEQTETAVEEDGSDAERTLAFVVSDAQPIQIRRRSSRTSGGQAAAPLRRSNRRRGNSGVFATRASIRMPSHYRRAGFPPLLEPYAARTLSQQRQVQATVHNRLQNMRDNWSRLRSGEMQFPSVSDSISSTRPASETGGFPSSSIHRPQSALIEAAAPRANASNGGAAEVGDFSLMWAHMDMALRLRGSTSGTSRQGAQDSPAETRARTRERLLHTNANLRTVSLGEGQIEGGAHPGAGSERKLWEEDYRAGHIDEQIDFLSAHSSSSRDLDLRRSARLERARRADEATEGDQAEILGNVSDNSRSGYNFRGSNRQSSTRTYARDPSNNVHLSPRSRETARRIEILRGHDLIDDGENSRGSGRTGSLTRRDSRSDQDLSGSSILDRENSRGSTGVTTRRRGLRNCPMLEDKDNTRSSTGPVTRRESSQYSTQSLAQGREQSSSRDPQKDERMKVMKEQCLKFVHAALRPMLIRGTIEKNQCKELARSATHTILSSLGVTGLKCASNVTMGIVTCDHEEPFSSSLIPGCCNDCVQRHVTKFVKIFAQDSLHLHRSRM